MAAKVTRIEGIDKNIFVEDNFVSAPKSLLATSIFNVKGRTDKLEIVKENFLGYKVFKLLGTSLNLGIDFQFFISIMLKHYETNSNIVTISTHDVYKRLDHDNTQAQNNNGIFLSRLKESALRIMDLKMELSNDFNSFILSTLFSTIHVDTNKKIVNVAINPYVKEIFKIDSNAIYNINFDIYNALSYDYSKALYLYYLTNNANIMNTLSVEDLRDRLLCHDVEDKKFNFNVNKANEELKSKDIGYLKYAEKVFTRVTYEDGTSKKKLTHYKISSKAESLEQAELMKKEKNEKVKEVKQKKVEQKVEKVEVKEEKPKKPDLKKTMAQLEFERHQLESLAFNNKLKGLL